MTHISFLNACTKHHYGSFQLSASYPDIAIRVYPRFYQFSNLVIILFIDLYQHPETRDLHVISFTEKLHWKEILKDLKVNITENLRPGFTHHRINTI